MQQKLILILYISLLTNVLKAQTLSFEFHRFDSIIRNNKLHDFPDLVEIKCNDETYEAFLSGTKKGILMLKVSQTDSYNSFEKMGESFLLKGHKAIYFETELISTLMVQHQLWHVAFSFSLNDAGAKELLIQIAEKSALLDEMPAPPEWPPVIETSERIEGNIIMIRERATAPDGYLKAFEVYVLPDSQIYESLKKLMHTNNFSENYIKLQNSLLVINDCSLTSIESCLEEKTILQLNYFITMK